MRRKKISKVCELATSGKPATAGKLQATSFEQQD
jgi:hypothetical protein